MDVILASVTPSVANNSLPPPPRPNRRKSNVSNGSSSLQSENQQSSAHRNPKLSVGAQDPSLSNFSRRPSAPATYYDGPFPVGNSRDDGTLDRKLQRDNVPSMLFRGHSAQARMEGPTQPAPSEGYLDPRYLSSTQQMYPNVPLSSPRSSLERSGEWAFYAPSTYRQGNNPSACSFFTGRSSPDPTPPPISARQSFTSPEPQSRPAKANKILGTGVSNTVPSHSRHMEHQPPRRSYDKDEHGVQWSRKSKANKLLGLTPDEGITFAPPPRSHSSGPPGRPATPLRRDAPDLEMVNNSDSHSGVDGASGAQEIGDPVRWRKEGFMVSNPSVTSHQKSKSHPETLSRIPGSVSSFQTVFSMMSTDSGIPEFTKRRPESIGKSQPNTTLKAFKVLMKKADGKTKGGQAEGEWEKVDAQEAEFGPWGWGVSSLACEKRPSEWGEAHTLPDEEQEERTTPEQTTPKQTTLDLSRAQSAVVSVLDQEERLAVIRKKMKITQLLGTDVPPYALGPAAQDRTSMERQESWEPLNKKGTTYIDARGKVREGGRFSDSSHSFVSEDMEQSSRTSSILAADDGVNEYGKRDRAPDSPTSFMELSDEEVGSHHGRAKGVKYFPQFSEAPIVEPPTLAKVSMQSSNLNSGRAFSTFTTIDPSFSPPGGKTLKYKPSFITEILEESDWEAHERKKKRDKLAKIHRFLGSRVPAELVLGYSSVTVPPAALLLEEGKEDAEKGRGNGRMDSQSVGWKTEHEMRNLSTMVGSEKIVQTRRVQKIEKMFGEQPPSALLRPNASLLASTPPSSSSFPPSHPAYVLPSHSAPRLGAPHPTSSYGPTPFTANVTYNINSLYEHSKGKKYKARPKPPLFSITNGTNSDSSSTSSAAGSTTRLINDFREQERRGKGKARLTAPPEDMVLDISHMDKLPASLHKELPHSSRARPPPLKGRHSAQFVHYRNSFKSLAMIFNQGDITSLQELYAMLNSVSPAGSDTEAELAHTKHFYDVSGYDSDSTSHIGTVSRRRSHPSRKSVVSMSSVSSGSSLYTLTPEPMGFQARRKRAAKLTNFFGASYRDLFGEVLERLEIGFLEEAREGNMSSEETSDLMGQVKTLKGRKTDRS